MIERAKRPEEDLEIATEPATVLDDRLLHMTREEAKAYLDAYLQERGLATGSDAVDQESRELPGRSGGRPAAR
jgi:hypothetical protein